MAVSDNVFSNAAKDLSALQADMRYLRQFTNVLSAGLRSDNAEVRRAALLAVERLDNVANLVDAMRHVENVGKG